MADESGQLEGGTITETQQPSKPTSLPIEPETKISLETLADIGAKESPIKPVEAPYKHPLEAMFEHDPQPPKTPNDLVSRETTALLPQGEAAPPVPAAAEPPPEVVASPAPLAPPKEAAPEVPPPAKVQTEAENRAFAEARRAEKARKEALDELQAERARVAAMEAERARLFAEQQAAVRQQTEDTYQPEPDPLQQMQAEMQQLKQQLEQKSVDDQLNAQAVEFARSHTDYQDALQYYIADERRDAEESGELDVVADRVLSMAADRVRQFAYQQGITQAEAAREMAVGVIFEARKQALVTAMGRTGKSVVETIYNRAQRRGFKGTAAQAAEAVQRVEEQAALPNPMISAVAQIEQEQRRGASESLSTLPRSNATPPRQFMSRGEVMSYLQTLDVREADRFMDRMDRQDPRWMERLPS